MKSTKLSVVILLFLCACNLDLYCQSDTIETKEQQSTYVMNKSPSGAIWRSLVVPGWGQLYVESYWKAPIFFAATGTLVYFIIDNQVKFNDYDNRMAGMDKTNKDYSNLKLFREYYRDNRDMSGFYLLAVYILAAVDAYVGAHLYDFQVDDTLAMQFGLSAAPVPAVSFTIRF
ncbi:MAG: DUF5683 domain-containing protein [Candidatus Kapabacteria bacterium]|jgi:hypothetical protein|nr:DUF5683 domain-containing protein [Candidatus Kapabacteria bacterium]